MKNRFRFLLLLFVALFVVLIICVINLIGRDNTEEIIRINEREPLFRVFNAESAKYMIYDMFIDDAKWNSDKYPISQHFKEKYKSKYDISDDFTENNSIGADLEYANDKGIRIIVDCSLKDKSANKNYVRYHYDCIVDNNGELYDLEYKFKVPYVYTIDEHLGKTYKRSDGKYDTKEYPIYNLLAYIANKYVNDDFDFNPYEDFKYSEEKMPYAENCRIINRPDLDVIGIPEFSYWYNSNWNEDYNGNDIYSKDGFPYLVFEYDDHKIKYEVKYHVNDEYFFDYIEFVEVKN